MSAVPTDEQVHEERSESGTQVGVTSPYALFSLSPHSELQRRIGVTTAVVIGGNGCSQNICQQTGIRRTRSAGC